MADATLIRIADAVVAAINAGSFTPAVTAARVYQATRELKEVGTMRCSVMPQAWRQSLAGRGEDRADYIVQLAIQKKLDPGGDVDAEMDTLMKLMQDLGAHLNRRELTDIDATWVGTVNEPVWGPEDLENLRQFTSVLTLTYRAIE